MRNRFNDFCHVYHWSGTAGTIVAGKPTTRFCGMQTLALNSKVGSAGASIVVIKDGSTSGAKQFVQTASAVSEIIYPPIPIEMGDMYISAAAGTVVGLDVILYTIKDD